MRGQIWKLPEQEITFDGTTTGLPVGALEIADQKYILLSEKILPVGNTIEVLQGRNKNWFPTHLFYQGQIDSIEIVDDLPLEILESYLVSPTGIQGIIMGLSNYYPYPPKVILELLNHWMNNAV